MAAESESADLERDVAESMRMFERSKVGAAATILAKTPARVLLVLDGSAQDITAAKAVTYLHDRFQTDSWVIDARERGDIDSDLAPDRAEQIRGAAAIERPPGDAYDAILAAVEEHSPDLVIVPCPFGRSFDQVGVDSVGTVIDVLLARCPRPLLVIRRDDQDLADATGDISLVTGAECDVDNQAAAWAFGLAEKSATLTLDLVIEREQFENMRSLLEAIHPDETVDPNQFSDALAKTNEVLHGSMAKTASTLGLSYSMRPIAGEVAPPSPLTNKRKMLLVMPLEVDDRFGQGFVHDRIRRSPHPVLVVPGHVSR